MTAKRAAPATPAPSGPRVPTQPPIRDPRAPAIPPSRRWRALAPTVLALVVIAIAAAAWAALVLRQPGHWLFNLDLPKIDFPLAAFFHEALGEGRLPLWNDRLGLGFPLYAEGQIGAFYPPNWLLYQLPPATALDVSRVLHLALAGVGSGLLVLRIRGSRPGAVVATLVAILGGAITAKLEWHNLVTAYAFLPWILLPLLRRPEPSRGGLVAAGTLFGIQALAGHPNTWLLTGIALTVVLVVGAERPLDGLRRAIGVGLLGGAIGMVQLLPTALLTTLSVRSTALSEADLFGAAATPFDPLGFAFQGTFARIVDWHWDFYTGWYPDGTFAQLEAAAYVGLPVLALAAGAARLRRSRPILVAALVMIAIPVIEAFQPGFLLSVPFVNGLRSPVRAYLVASLLIGVLAGIAVGRPTRLAMRPRAATVALVLFVGAYAATVGLALFAPATFDAIVLASTSFGSADEVAGRHQLAVDALTAPWPLLAELACGAAILSVILVAARRPRWGAAAIPAAVIVAAIPLVLFGPVPNEAREFSYLSSADSPFIQAVAGTSPRRMVTIDPPGFWAGMPDQPAAAGIADLRMFSSLNLRASDDVLESAAHDTPEAALLRRALGVDTVVTFDDAPCPGIPLASSEPDRALICRDEAALHAPYWIPARAATVETAGRQTTGSGPLAPREASLDLAAVLETAVPLEVEERSADSLRAVVDAPADGWVWIDRSWWPGWTTRVDGVPVETLRAIGGQLVPVPAGNHRVEQALVPWDALLGLAVGTTALAIALAWLWKGRSRPRASALGLDDDGDLGRHATVDPDRDLVGAE